jgi:secernin
MCDTVVVVRGEGDARKVWFAKNSDRPPDEAQHIERYGPRRTSRVMCTHMAIDDVEQTLPVLLSRPAWMWGAEMGANAAGLCVGNEAVFAWRKPPRMGLTGMDLVRLTLERARTVDEGLSVLEDLLTRYPQGGACAEGAPSQRYWSTFILADASGAAIVETLGKQRRTQRVLGARAVSNATLSFPRQENAIVAACGFGRQRSARLASLAEAATSPEDLMAALGDHAGHDAPRAGPLLGTLDHVCMHGGGVAPAVTARGWVSELTSTGVRHWVSNAPQPCTGGFREEPVEDGEESGENAGPASRASHDHTRAARSAATVAACSVLLSCLLACAGAPDAPGEVPFTLLSANVGTMQLDCEHYAYNLCEADIEDEAAASIAALSPDIVVLQEVTTEAQCAAIEEQDPSRVCHPSRTAEVPAQIDRLLGRDYDVRCDARAGFECYGVRADAGLFLDDEVSTPALPDGCDPNFSVSAIDVRLLAGEGDGVELRLLNGHPASGWAYACRAAGVRLLFEVLASDEHINLVAGDMNLDPWQHADESVRAWDEHVAFDNEIAPEGDGPRFRYHSGVVEASPPIPSIVTPLGELVLDHVVSDGASGGCVTLDGREGAPRLVQSLDMDHRALFCELAVPRQ